MFLSKIVNINYNQATIEVIAFSLVNGFVGHNFSNKGLSLKGLAVLVDKNIGYCDNFKMLHQFWLLGSKD